MAIDPTLFQWLKNIDGKLDASHAKLDEAKAALADHRLEDLTGFSTATGATRELRAILDRLLEQKAKEESERKIARIAEQRSKETDIKRKDAWKLARYAGWFSIVAVLVGALATSSLTLLEQHRSKVERAMMLQLQEKTLQKVGQ